MRIKNRLASRLFSLLLLFLIIGCAKEKKTNPFEIGLKKIGLLTPEIKVNELDSIFRNDSIVKHVAGDEFIGNSNAIEIFEKGGKKLLLLEATEEFDSTATIENILIIDSRYQTTKGLSSKSIFKDVRSNYTVSKINNTLSTLVVFLDSTNVYFSIDKKELPSNLRNGTDLKIEARQIPDSAKIKNLWLHWDEI